MKRAILTVLLISSSLVCSGQDATTPVFVNDGEIKTRLLKEGERLLEAGKTVDAKDLMAKIPSSATLKLVPPAVEPLTSAQIYQRVKAGVLIVGSLYKCEKCTRWHCSAASGFLIGPSGVAVTAYHVVASTGRKTFVAMTSDGVVRPVTAVLAASEQDDVAIIQIDAADLVALPLRGDAPVGTRVSVIHHPDSQFYMLTEGLLSRYNMRTMKDRVKAPGMAITAEFARGSSGAPVFDEQGNVIGLVCSTRTIYYSDERKDPQMVLHDCAPAFSVLKLITPEK